MNSARLLILIVLIVITACSSGKKAYEHGNYYEAVMQSVNRLRQNPDHSKSMEALRNSYPMALENLQTDANNQIASNSPSKWRNAIAAYDKINQMYETIRQSPGALKVIPNPKNFYNEIGPLKEKAAEESYNAGIEALMKGTREDAKRAYFNFADAQAFVPGYKDVVEYLDKAKFEATLIVALEQVAVPNRYSLSGGFFQDKVEEYLHQNYTDRGFVKFYTPEEIKNIKLQRVDQILRIQFDDFSVGNTTVNEKEETVKKDSVKVGEAKVDGKTIPVYNTVSAKLTTVKKEVVSTGLLSMIVMDAKTNGVLQHKKFSGEYSWVSSWGRFNGDDRALTDQQLAMCKRKEQQPPVAQDLFLEFTRPIYNQLIPALQGFYRNY
ncbi:MAG TPA: hypothetical protein VFU05_12570 [Cyclobacteriaceae bacterium]|nr:hypothetical protein [Cyclobacteriaceae bacterium]